MENIKKITIEDKNYPRILKKIKHAPKILYFKGEIKPSELCFAVVGTRTRSFEGSERLARFPSKTAGIGICPSKNILLVSES